MARTAAALVGVNKSQQFFIFFYQLQEILVSAIKHEMTFTGEVEIGEVIFWAGVRGSVNKGPQEKRQALGFSRMGPCFSFKNALRFEVQGLAGDYAGMAHSR